MDSQILLDDDTCVQQNIINSTPDICSDEQEKEDTKEDTNGIETDDNICSNEQQQLILKEDDYRNGYVKKAAAMVLGVAGCIICHHVTVPLFTACAAKAVAAKAGIVTAKLGKCYGGASNNGSYCFVKESDMQLLHTFT